MQNVSNLQIPEGTVRTIHDKNNRLIWGRLAYDTKYAGDTSQNGTPTPGAPIPVQTVAGEQTVNVTGKNLLGMQNVAEFTQNGVKISVQDGVISLDGTANASTGVVITSLINDLVFEQGKSYTFSAQVLSGSVDSGYNFQIRDANSTNVVSTSPWYYPATYNNLSGVGKAVRLYYGSGRVFTNYKIKIQVEQGSSATTYEPYQSQSYHINLGSIELCKIGAYQDYIYQNDGDWYVHREIGKYTFTGTENWVTSSYGTNSWSVDHLFTVHGYNVNEVVEACDFAQGIPHSKRGNYDNPPTCVCYWNSSSERFLVRNTTITAQADMQTSTKGKNVYYWSTPTDTQITDATLVGQLNAVHEWLTRYGYNATVTGSLPIIISKTNL